MIQIRDAIYNDLEEIFLLDKLIFDNKSYPLKFWSQIFYTGKIFVVLEELKIIGFVASIIFTRDDELININCIKFMEHYNIDYTKQIVTIGVSKEHQNKGIGQSLLTRIINDNKVLALPITLNVNTLNEKALKLYRKNMFQIYCEIPNYYGHVNGNSYLMFLI